MRRCRRWFHFSQPSPAGCVVTKEEIEQMAAQVFKELDAIEAKVRERLDWRGPNGNKSRYVVLERADAAKLIGYDDSKA